MPVPLRNLAMLAVGAALTLAAADGILIWPKATPPAGTPKGGAKFANHALSVSHRDKDGSPEVHQKVTDIFYIKAGEADLLLGGEVVGGKTESPNEVRGGTIKGGHRSHVSAGDVVHIPAGTPHQFFVAPGKTVDYFVVKVDNP
jgi:mannose-6-phosphate isomerase-like protein (cupin superfamily)